MLRMVEPFYNAYMGGTIHTKMWAQRFNELRGQAIDLPKYGTDTADQEVLYIIKIKLWRT